MWTLHHYWSDEQASTLRLTDWRNAIGRIDGDDSDAMTDIAYMHTWASAVVDSAEGFIA